MNGRLIYVFMLGVPLGFLLLVGLPGTAPVVSGKTIKVARETLAVWSTYEGVLESRSPTLVMSRVRGGETLVVEIAPEGPAVSRGDLLVQFDATVLEREVIRLERDYAAAESELNSFQHAKAMLELRGLKKKVVEARTSLTAEQNYLNSLIQLAKEDLVSEQEIDQQKAKVTEITSNLDTSQLELKLTMDYLHPATLKRAQAKLDAAVQELRLAREQVQNSIILAPKDGVVIYKPLHIGAEFRTVRIGDILYPNQPFMMLTDMHDLVVHCDVPEAELGRVQEGKEVFIQPLAFSGVRLRGVVENISPMAQNAPGRPVWEKFFHIVIGLSEGNAQLRPGMSVTAQVLSSYKENALAIPRTAVWWDDGKPYGKVVTGSSQEIRPLKLGMANERAYEVLEGLELGTEIVTQ